MPYPFITYYYTSLVPTVPPHLIFSPLIPLSFCLPRIIPCPLYVLHVLPFLPLFPLYFPPHSIIPFLLSPYIPFPDPSLIHFLPSSVKPTFFTIPPPVSYLSLSPLLTFSIHFLTLSLSFPQPVFSSLTLPTPLSSQSIDPSIRPYFHCSLPLFKLAFCYRLKHICL